MGKDRQDFKNNGKLQKNEGKFKGAINKVKSGKGYQGKNRKEPSELQQKP